MSHSFCGGGGGQETKTMHILIHITIIKDFENLVTVVLV